MDQVSIVLTEEELSTVIDAMTVWRSQMNDYGNSYDYKLANDIVNKLKDMKKAA